MHVRIIINDSVGWHAWWVAGSMRSREWWVGVYRQTGVDEEEEIGLAQVQLQLVRGWWMYHGLLRLGVSF